MIELQFQPSPESLRELSRLEREAPKTFSAAYKFAITRSRKALVSVMKHHGGHGVPRFAARNEMTIRLGRGRRESGVLSLANRIKYTRVGPEAFFLSWVGTLGEWAAKKYQAGATYAFSKDMRYCLHRLRIKDVPALYERPDRPIIEPLHAYLAQNFHRYVLETFEKKLKAILRKGGRPE